MQAFGRNQNLFEPRTGGVVSAELATGNGRIPAIAPLPSNLPPKEAQTHKPVAGSVPKGFSRNLLTFRRRFTAVKKWLRL